MVFIILKFPALLFESPAYAQARSQKFAMGGLFRRSGGGAPSRWRPVGVWGEAPSCRRLGVWVKARGSVRVAPSARKFCLFLQKSLNFRAILIKKILLLKRGIEIGSAT